MNAHKPLPAASDALSVTSGTAGAALGSPASAAPNPSMVCRECDGKGEAEYMGLCDSYYRWSDCHKCNGTGREKPYCELCDKTLTIDGFCIDCDDFADGFAPPERIAPLPNGWSRLEL